MSSKAEKKEKKPTKKSLQSTKDKTASKLQKAIKDFEKSNEILVSKIDSDEISAEELEKILTQQIILIKLSQLRQGINKYKDEKTLDVKRVASGQLNKENIEKILENKFQQNPLEITTRIEIIESEIDRLIELYKDDYLKKLNEFEAFKALEIRQKIIDEKEDLINDEKDEDQRIQLREKIKSEIEDEIKAAQNDERLKILPLPTLKELEDTYFKKIAKEAKQQQKQDINSKKVLSKEFQKQEKLIAKKEKKQKIMSQKLEKSKQVRKERVLQKDKDFIINQKEYLLTINNNLLRSIIKSQQDFVLEQNSIDESSKQTVQEIEKSNYLPPGFQFKLKLFFKKDPIEIYRVDKKIDSRFLGENTKIAPLKFNFIKFGVVNQNAEYKFNENTNDLKFINLQYQLNQSQRFSFDIDQKTINIQGNGVEINSELGETKSLKLEKTDSKPPKTLNKSISFLDKLLMEYFDQISPEPQEHNETSDQIIRQIFGIQDDAQNSEDNSKLINWRPIPYLNYPNSFSTEKYLSLWIYKFEEFFGYSSIQIQEENIKLFKSVAKSYFNTNRKIERNQIKGEVGFAKENQFNLNATKGVFENILEKKYNEDNYLVEVNLNIVKEQDQKQYLRYKVCFRPDLTKFDILQNIISEQKLKDILTNQDEEISFIETSLSKSYKRLIDIFSNIYIDFYRFIISLSFSKSKQSEILRNQPETNQNEELKVIEDFNLTNESAADALEDLQNQS